MSSKLEKITGIVKKEVLNVVGDLLGYERCPISRDTFFGTKRVFVHIRKMDGVIMSARALEEMGAKKTAEEIFKKYHTQANSVYSEAEIKKEIERGDLIEITSGLYKNQR